MKLTLAFKLSIAAIFLVLVSAGSVGAMFYIETTRLLVDERVARIAKVIQHASHGLQEGIATQRENTRFLADTPAIQGILRARKSAGYDLQGKSSYKQWTKRLQSIFSNMFTGKPSYQKIRFIDNSGEELVVVSRENGAIVFLNENELQNKSHRTYVIETLKLNAGSLYLSEINLNREHGKVSVPHQQVLRSAIPIYDQEQGGVAGLLIITAEVGENLTVISESVQDEGINIFISNDRGDYILHPDKSKTYGFDLGHTYKIQSDIAPLTQQFLPGRWDDNIILRPVNYDNRHLVSFNRILLDIHQPGRFIGVSVEMLYSSIVAKVDDVLNHVVSLTLVMASGIAILAIVFSYHLTLPIKKITTYMDDYVSHRRTNIVMPVEQKDEIGLLARSFQALIFKVDDAQTELTDMNKNLEELVCKRTSDLAAARDEAELANLAKSEFLSRMSHELRTPLNAILGFGQILKLDEGSFDKTVKGNIDEILTAGRHLLELINGVLDLAKIEAGQIEISMEDVFIDDVLESCLAMIGPLTETLQLTIVDKLSKHNYYVHADYTRLKQVLVNLLSNAVKYNSFQGDIVVDGVLSAAGDLRIYVRDSGKGLTEKDISKLFNPFERLDASNNVEGAGIGLVITKHLVEVMGGNIGVESVPGVGCAFWVEFSSANKVAQKVA